MCVCVAGLLIGIALVPTASAQSIDECEVEPSAQQSARGALDFLSSLDSRHLNAQQGAGQCLPLDNTCEPDTFRVTAQAYGSGAYNWAGATGCSGSLPGTVHYTALGIAAAGSCPTGFGFGCDTGEAVASDCFVVDAELLVQGATMATDMDSYCPG